MKKEPIFTPIDKATWAMAQQFYYYTEMAPTTYTVNVTLDVTILRKTLKANSIKFFPVILSILVDTFFTRISMPKLLHPEIHNISAA